MGQLEYDLLRDVEALWIAGRQPILPFEKEMTLFRFKIWALAPTLGPRASNAARWIARIVLTHKVNLSGQVMTGQISTLLEYRTRLNDNWLEQFCNSSFFQEWVGDLTKAFGTSNIAKAVSRRRAQLEMSIDMLDFLLRAAKYNPKVATRRCAIAFISRNGFNRVDNYGVLIGEKKRPRVEKQNLAVSPITVERAWDTAPQTLGLVYLIAKSFSRLDSLDSSDEGLLVELVRLANKDNYLRRLLGHYEWLLDFCAERLPNLGKHVSWPRLTHAVDPMPLSLKPLTPDQLRIVEKAPRKQS